MGISKSSIWSLMALAAVLIGIPLAVIIYEANRTAELRQANGDKTSFTAS